jgi:hypothetical protein
LHRIKVVRQQGVRSPAVLRALFLPLLLSLLLAACSANGDFGRLKPELVHEDIHAWVGRDAAREAGVPVSKYPLTDEERLLRDLAYPLIEPPFERARWYAIVNEYGISHRFGWPQFRIDGYFARLMHRPYASATARYEELNDDIRNDVLRVPEFFAAARAVLDLDHKRAESFQYVGGLTREEKHNGVARIAENELVIGWAQRAVAERSDAYCFALQRLVIATPNPLAVEAERSLTLLNSLIAANHVLDGPLFGPPAVVCGPQVVAAVPVAVPAITK